MSRNEKLKFIRLIEGSEIDTASALKKYDIPPSTYYRWKRKMKSMGINGLEITSLTGQRPGISYCPMRLIKFWNVRHSTRICHLARSALISLILSILAYPKLLYIVFSSEMV
jgi:hypothetical protein